MINPQLKTWVNFSTPEARSIVRKILASAPHHELGLRTHEIYERAHAEFPDVTTDIPPGKPIPTGTRNHGGRIKPAKPVPLPPKLDHAIRSVKYLKKTVLEEMVMAREIEKVHIKRGKLHEDGTRDISIVSKAHGKTDITSHLNMPESSIWRWRLTPDYETKINNYPKPPIEAILWKPGEKEARRKARGGIDSAILQQTKKYEKPMEETGKLDMSMGIKAINDAILQQTKGHEKPVEETGKLDMLEGTKADSDTPIAKRVKAPEFPAFGL
ncbi:uncharacterized protein EDB93DRAFT_1254124 [Suillus bovinus]|uniref:uncharacterized protein n=1 Tax=Suillus bovinus TaxID=48563 RepID=UPI001B860815|nr:uncharacterized protein EDB93DRAFT_1254124 [Suillus bovinus]KAG2135872.1 hypothetical protein EDB93DRAFT_1254124 [Suillus bovinus]